MYNERVVVVVVVVVFITVLAIDSLSSYYFMVDRRNGMTMYHPTLPYPMDSGDLPVMVNIAMLETYAYREGIIASILR